MDTEGRLERYRDADRWPTGESLAAMLDNQFAALAAVRDALPQLAAAAQAAAARLGDGSGRLIYAGAGASGRLAVQDGVELHPTFGWPHERLVHLLAGGEAALVRSLEGAEDDEAAGRAAVDALCPGREDVLIAVAAHLGTFRGVRRRWRTQLLRTVAAQRKPTLVVWGAEDRILPASHLEHARQVFPHAQFHLFEKTGHMPQIEREEEFDALVRRFVGGVEARG